MQPIEGVTPDMVWTFMLVLVALGGLIVLADKVADVFRKHKKRKEQPDEKLADEISRKVAASMEGRFADINRKLANDKEMIESHTLQINELRMRTISNEKGIRALCKGMMALLNNATNRGNDKEINDANDTFKEYLMEK